MKSVFVFPLRLLAFWLIFFAVFRAWFVGWFRKEWSPQEPFSAWASLWHALPLDLSMAAYLIAVPVLLWFLGLSVGKRSFPVFSKIITGFNVILISILVLVFGSNVFIYEEWHTLLNSRALEYLRTPSALLDSMSLPFKIVSVGLYAFFVWLMWRLNRMVVGSNIYPENTSRWSVLVLPVHLGLLLIALRGGLGLIPINESAVYFSPHLFDNHAATNSAWNLFHSLIEARSTKNHYVFMDEKAAEQSAGRLLGNCSTLTNSDWDIFENQDSIRPNLVFIIMESHTAEVVEELGGEAGVCPNMSRLIKGGILFENIYSSGYRTDQGLVSILGGYPAQPDQSIILLSDKAVKLNSISKILKERGYSTAFFYGGELTFANIGQWLGNQRFEKVLSEKDFSNAQKTQLWGVDDHTVLQRTALEINKLKEPFFATAMTLSLHPPFDVPFQSKWQGQTERDKFFNSAAFADYAIGEFFKTAEQQPWYQNTLFVLVADHGSDTPYRIGYFNPKSRHIPLILFGEPLSEKWHGKRLSVFGNHHDIPATILSLWNIRCPDFRWSKNLWDIEANTNKRPATPAEKMNFAFYTNENGLGWATPQGKASYQFNSKEWEMWEGQVDSASQTDAKAYLQVLYDDFLKK